MAAEEEMITLFQDILIDLPCGEYFRKFIDKIIASSREGDQNADTIDMAQIGEKINSLSSADQLLRVKKIWKSDFHRWIMANCNESTREWMDGVLKAEADWETLQVHYMGFLPRRGGGDASAAGKDMFRNLQHNMGNLYPANSELLGQAKDYTEFVNALQCTPYHEYFTKIADPGVAANEVEIDSDLTIDDFQKRDLSKRYSLAYFGQFHYGVFYAFLKLKEIEIANITQLCQIMQLK